MSENVDIKNKVTRKSKYFWIIPISFTIAGLLLVVTNEASVLSGLLFTISGMMFSPIVKNAFANHLNKYLSIFIRLNFCILFMVLAITANDIKPQFEFASPQHEQFFYSVLEQDYQEALKSNDTILSSKQWFDVLGIMGITEAKDILSDFKKNEVKAVQKYRGSWLIEGRVTAIDNSFGKAIVGIGNTSELFNFNAEIKDKNRAASYNIGEPIQIYCRSITEMATLVNGLDCSDYRDWKDNAFKWAAKKKQNLIVRNGRTFKETQDLIKLGINHLPTDSTCFSDVNDKLCLEEYLAVMNNVNRVSN